MASPGITDPTTLSALQALDKANVLGNFDDARRQKILTAVDGEHSDTARKMYNDYIKSDDAANSMLFYYARNIDLKDVQSAVLERLTAEARGATHDSHLLKRQFEINEWTANNKSETLFLMQLLLIGVSFTIFLLFLNRRGFVPTSIFSIVVGLLLISFILTVVIRAQYTNKKRSNRYCNRYVNPGMEKPVPEAGCPVPLSPAPGPAPASQNIGEIAAKTGENVGNAAETALGAVNCATSKLSDAFGRLTDY